MLNKKLFDMKVINKSSDFSSSDDLSFKFDKLSVRHGNIADFDNLKFSRTIRVKMLFSYILAIAICTLIISIPIYKYVSRKMTEQSVLHNTELLEQLKNTTDAYIFDNINRMSLNILNNSSEEDDIMYFFNNPYKNNLKGIKNVYVSLLSFKSLNSSIHSISIYYKNNSLILSSEGMKLLSLQSKPDWIDTSWIELYNDKGGKGVVWLETHEVRNPDVHISMTEGTQGKFTKNVITLVRALTAPDSRVKMLGAIAISIDQQALVETVKATSRSSFEQIFCINTDGTIISHNQDNLLYSNVKDQVYGEKLLNTKDRNGSFVYEDNGVQSVVSYSVSAYNDWKYVCISPISQLPTSMEFFNRFLISVALMTFIIGTVLSLLSTSKLYVPLKRLRDVCKNIILHDKSFSRARNEYDVINLALNTLMFKIKDQRKVFEENIPIIKHHFITDLLNGNFFSIGEVYNKMNLLNINFPHEYFMIIILKLNNKNTNIDQLAFEYSKISVIEAIESFFKERNIPILSAEYNMNIVTVLNYHCRDANITNSPDHLLSYLDEFIQYDIQIGIGSICNNIMKLVVSYKQACECIKYSYIYPEKRIFYPEEVCLWEENNSSESIKLIFDEFCNLLKQQYMDEALFSLHELIMNVQEEHFSYNSTVKLFTNILSFLEAYIYNFKINPSTIIPDDFASYINKTGNILEFYDWMCSLINKVSSYIDNKRNQRNLELIDKAKEYISENITNKDLSLDFVSNEMYISPNYLSRIFKEETGANFIDYVTELRLDLSRNLLLSGNMKVEDIAAAIGYSSSQYFIKKFKIKYGLTPKQYLIDCGKTL